MERQQPSKPPHAGSSPVRGTISYRSDALRLGGRFIRGFSVSSTLTTATIARLSHVRSVKVNQDRADAWYLAISEFLESKAGDEDVAAPGSLVMALCRVLADAVEQVDAPDRKKIEAVVRLTAQAMGFNDALLMLGKDADPDRIS